MNKQLEQNLADSLEAKVEMLPYISFLLQDLWALGSSPQLYVELLKPLNLKANNTKVLDLGCGKGAVAVTIAKELGFSVTGIDAYEPFLETAKEKAKEFDVSELCRFEFGDLKEFIKTAKDFDIVFQTAVGNVLGGVKDIVEKLRQTIRPGGYILYDEGFLKDNVQVDKDGYEHLLPYNETKEKLTFFGDSIIEEIILKDEETIAMNNEYMRFIKPRADELTQKYPKLKDVLSWYMENQSEECEILNTQVASAMWLVQKK